MILSTYKYFKTLTKGLVFKKNKKDFVQARIQSALFSRATLNVNYNKKKKKIK